MCSAHRNPAIDGDDLTTAPGVNDGKGSRTVLQDRSGDERSHTSSASTPTPRREDDVTRGCLLP